MKARHLCAVAGLAVAVAAVVFMRSLVSTNDAQAQVRAERFLAENPLPAGAKICRAELDFRPEGRVMQGPPMRAAIASGGEVADGRCVVFESLFAQRRLAPPPVGSELTFLGAKGAFRLTIAALLPSRGKSAAPRGYPNVIVSDATAAAIAEEWSAWTAPTVAELAPRFMSDAGRNFDRAKALLLWAAVLTALCLLVNSLFLTVEAKRREIALLRVVGMTRGGVAWRMVGESFALALAGFALGVALALAGLALYVALDSELFPEGFAVSWRTLAACAVATPVVAALAALVALQSALAVKPLEAASARMPRKRHLGMTIAFACGFGAFVAVEVWGASLMRAFVPSAEWPDAIVSILPAGVSSFDIERLQQLPGVKRVAELQPLQVNFDPLDELQGFSGKSAAPESETQGAAKGGGQGAAARGGGKSAAPEDGGQGGARRGMMKQYRNALLLASDWMPRFKVAAGALGDRPPEGDACVITEMMARARGLKVGDDLKLDCGRGFKMSLKVAAIVDLNWHLVTSRGLVRGLNRMPVNTDGPVFVSFDTLDACDARPSQFVKMTHLWLDYDENFLAAHGVFEAGRIVEKGIADVIGSPENTIRLHARDEVADGTLAHGAELIGSMARVPFIFVAVISLGFIAMLIASADARKREFRVLRAIGATRAQIVRALAGEALSVAVKGVALGVVFGAAAGWLFTFATRAAMANWGIPPCFAVPWGALAIGAALSVLFALMIAIPTALAVVKDKK